jgi:hypothetical protein
MARSRSAFLVAVLASLALPSLASAQTTIQGQIIIQEATPSTTTAPPPQATVYAAPPTTSPQSVYVTPGAPAQMQCPAGAVMQADRYGRTACMIETTRHRISGGLLGGGIGMLAGGWVASIFTTLFTGIVFSFGTSSAYTSSDLNNYVTFGFIPLIGPWVQMGFLPGSTDTGAYVWYAFEGLLQVGGLIMLIFGAIGEDAVEYTPAPGYAFNLRPMISPTVQGLSAELRF